MRPWFIQITTPLTIPYFARADLEAIATGLTREEYVDKIWETRDEAFGPVKKSRKKNWPINRGPAVISTVIQLPKRKKLA